MDMSTFFDNIVLAHPGSEKLVVGGMVASNTPLRYANELVGKFGLEIPKAEPDIATAILSAIEIAEAVHSAIADICDLDEFLDNIIKASGSFTPFKAGVFAMGTIYALADIVAEECSECTDIGCPANPRYSARN